MMRPAPARLRPQNLARFAEDFTCYPVASFAARGYALALDLALSAPLGILIKQPTDRLVERLAVAHQDGRWLAMQAALVLAPLFLYAVVPTAVWGQTLGKRIVGIRVVRPDGRTKLGLLRALLREGVLKPVSGAAVGLGFVLALLTRRRRAFHDWGAGTVVVAYRDIVD